MNLTPEEIAYVRRLMWRLPKWDSDEAAFNERLERALDDGQ